LPRNPHVNSITGFLPCYNDAKTIGELVRKLDGTLTSLVDDYEIIVVDDGSSDDSLAVLMETSELVPALKVISHRTNRGYGGALISGFAASTKEWIFYTDGDAQYDPGQLVDLVAAADSSVDIVQGWKLERSDYWHRKAIGGLYNRVVRTMFRLTVRDTDCDFRLFRRALLDRQPLRRTSGTICVEMMRKFQVAGARFAEVPVNHYWRPHGRSQFFRLPHLTRMSLELLGLWWAMMIRGDDTA
jgi:glycosyltransferase involved in cell wall biosynthesis